MYDNLMKKILIGLILALTLVSPAYADVWVNGYYRSNGTYVNGHYRSSPDGNPYNNYSFPGNTNPYTGKTAGGNPSTYLNNYYESSGSYSIPSPYYMNTPSTPTCPINSYYDGVSSCKCNYGYVIGSSGRCTSASLVCSQKIGLMSQYNSLTKTCECMSGYEFDGSMCVYKNTSSNYSGGYYSSVGSCPKNSHQSVTNFDKCTCDSGYQIDLKGKSCVAINHKNSDKVCQADYGTKSEWSGETNETGSITCSCKVGYDFNTKGTKCIRVKK